MNVKKTFDTPWRVGAGFVALSLLVGHWLPWSFFLAGRTLPRIPAYIYGSTMVFGGFSIWRGMQHDRDAITPAGLLGLYVVGFVATCAAYLADEVAKAAAKANAK